LRKPNYVVIHHTAQDSVQQTLRTFTLPRTQVSAHYVVAKDGTVYHMLNDYYGRGMAVFRDGAIIKTLILLLLV
jgi:hypothetical protein